MAVPLSLNCTVPAAFTGITDTENVTGAPVVAEAGTCSVVVVGAFTVTVCAGADEFTNPDPARKSAVML
ncbi:hypothetical protein H849_00881 [Prescottella equi NBRC 101255 = C 7]|nr:hypothetical protein H849_00881 [Prescottella equi NBRC 101255 = C 7]